MDDQVNNSPFLQEVVSQIRVRHYSRRTEEAYLHWIKRYIYFHKKRHPREMGEPEVGRFLSDLAVRGNVAAATQNLALNALVFLYRHVLERPLKEIHGVVRAKKPQRLPVVLSREEVARVLARLQGQYWLIACLQYGSGLRLIESVRLRVMDLDFEHRAIFVRNGKGGKDRVVTLADELITPLRRHLEVVRTLGDYQDTHRKLAKNIAIWQPFKNISHQGAMRCPSQGKSRYHWKPPLTITVSHAAYVAPFYVAWTHTLARALSIDASGSSIASRN
jgi:integrase